MSKDAKDAPPPGVRNKTYNLTVDGENIIGWRVVDRARNLMTYQIGRVVFLPSELATIRAFLAEIEGEES